MLAPSNSVCPALLLQTGMPMTGLAVLAGEWRLKPADRRVLNTVYLPWALRAGARAADLMCIYYEKHLEVSCLGVGGGGALLLWSISAVQPILPCFASTTRSTCAASCLGVGVGGWWAQ